MSKEVKSVNLRVSMDTKEKLVAITRVRKKADRLDSSQKNIIKGLVDAAHKKEVENANPNK